MILGSNVFNLIRLLCLIIGCKETAKQMRFLFIDRNETSVGLQTNPSEKISGIQRVECQAIFHILSVSQEKTVIYYRENCKASFFLIFFKMNKNFLFQMRETDIWTFVVRILGFCSELKSDSSCYILLYFISRLFVFPSLIFISS